MPAQNLHLPRNGAGLGIQHIDVVRPKEEFRRTVGRPARRKVERLSIEPHFAVLDVHRRVDNDQVHLFVHVREYAREAQIYINRYLRREDRVSAHTLPCSTRTGSTLDSPMKEKTKGEFGAS